MGLVNVQVQVCALLLNIMVQILFFGRRNLKLKTTSVFASMILVDFVSVVLDIVSVALIQIQGPTEFTLAVNRIYLMSVVWLAYLTAQYLVVDVQIKAVGNGFARTLLKIMMVLATMALVILPINVKSTGWNNTYAYGTAVTFTYAMAVFYVISIITALFIHGGRISSRRLNSFIVCVLTISTAGTVQFFNHSCLIMGFASAICITLIFVLLENPESYVDRDSGCYNMTALFAYMDENYTMKERFSLLGVQITNLHFLYEKYSTEEVKDLLTQIAEMMSREQGAYVCKRADWEYVLFFDRVEDMNSCSEALQSRFDNAWVIGTDITKVDVKFTEVPDSTIVDDSEEMYDLFRRFGKGVRRDSHSDRVTYITKEIVDAKRYKKEVEKEIVEAIEEGRIETFYQPIYSTSKEKYISAEVLVRIRKKDKTLMYPGEFIPVAEETGLIVQLGEIVFKKTCEFIVNSEPEKFGIEYLEVNLSAVQSSRFELADEFIDIMKEVGVNPKMINLEITESAAISSKEALTSNIEKLTEFGVSFSLDDFGTGYSNIEYIMELPIEIVKFDKNFTQAYFVDDRKKMIMEKVIKMIRSAHFKIVSEGVEEKEQLSALIEMDIDYIQGYYFSKPVQQSEFEDLLERESA